MLEDKLLIWKLNRGNQQVLHRIYEKYKDNLVTLAAGLLFDTQVAEDTVHDVFISFINNSRNFRLTGSLKAYLATCVANLARNKNTALSRSRSLPLDHADNISSDSDSPAGKLIFGEQLQHLALSLNELPYDQREVIILRHYAGLKFKTIASMHDESINTIQGRYRYGLKKLKSLLNGELKNETAKHRQTN